MSSSSKHYKVLEHCWVRLIIYFVILLPFIFLREIDSVAENTLLAVADEALRTGNFWCPTLHGEFFTEIPPLYIWTIMLGKSLLGVKFIPFLELFSAIPALLTILILYLWTKKDIRKKYRYTAEIVLFSSVWFFFGAVLLRPDMLFTFFIVTALYAFWRITIKAGKHDSAFFIAAVIAAVATKGIIGFLVPLACSAVYSISSKEWRPFFKAWSLPNVAILLGIVAIGVYFTLDEGGSEALRAYFTPSFAGYNPLYPIYTVFYAMAPWIILVIWAVARIFVKKMQISSLCRYMLLSAGTILAFAVLTGSRESALLICAMPMLVYGAFSVLYLMTQSHSTHSTARSIRTAAADIAILMLTAALLAGLFASETVSGYLAIN